MMRAAAINRASIDEMFVSGRIDRDGTVRARMSCGGCNYDLVWQKEHK
jgi:hypothetical protein